MNKIVKHVVYWIISLFVVYNIFLVYLLNITTDSDLSIGNVLLDPFYMESSQFKSTDDVTAFNFISNFYDDKYNTELRNSLYLFFIFNTSVLLILLLIIRLTITKKLSEAALRSLLENEHDDFLLPLVQELSRQKKISKVTTGNYDQINAYAAHEQKNVLNVLRVGITTGEMNDEDLLKQIDSINRTLEDILALTTNKIVFEEVDLTLTIAGVMDMYCTSEIEYDFCDVTIKGNANLITRALSNIIENSIKYGKAEGPKIKISTLVNKTSTVIIISDDGKNISSDTIEKIVEHNFQVDRNLAGYGIGLSLVKRVMDVHYGALDIINNSQGIDVKLIFANNVCD